MSRNYKWWVVGILWWVCFLNYADRQAFSAIFPSLQGEFALTPVELGFLGSAFAWVYALGGPFAGLAGDRFSRKWLIVGACAFWSLTTILTAFCFNVGQFAVVRALTGLGECLYFPAALSLMSDYHDRSSRSFAFSLHQSSVYIGSIGGSWLGAWLAELHGWRTGFWLFGGLGILLSIFLSRCLHEPARTETPQVEVIETKKSSGLVKTFLFLVSRKTSLLLILAFFAANFVAIIFLTWMPLFLVDRFHVSMAMAGFGGSAFLNVASAISVPIGGRIADRLAARFPGGRIAVQCVGMLVGSLFIVVVGLAENLILLFIGLTLFGFCKGIYDANIFAALYDVVEPRTRASAAGIMNALGWVGGALGPLAFGFVSQYGWHGKNVAANMNAALLLSAAVYAVAGILLFTAISTVRSDALSSPSRVA